MIREIKRLDKLDHAKANYVRILQKRGKIGKFLSDDGYVAYETLELKEYQKSARKGRPVKMETVLGK